MRARSRAPVRVARVIGRLNVGGPALQAIQLTRLLEDRGFQTRLFRGIEGAREGSMDDLAAAVGITPVRIGAMRRDVGPGDAAAIGALVRELRRFRPHVVHTEAAKAGTVGRVAVRLAFPPRRRPVVVHTFHGHSLEGYFSPARARAFLAVERRLARWTDQLVAVSEEVKADLVRLAVAPPAAVRVIELGLDLAAFDRAGPERERLARERRTAWGVPPGARVVTLVARLAPIKRVDRFLRVGARLLAADPELQLVVVGDGELAGALRGSTNDPRLHWAGWERDMPAVCFASDVVVLTSDNEGTPVSLIEASAAGVPVVSTRVGGVATVVDDGRTGLLAGPDDEAGLAARVLEALDRPELGVAGRRHVRERFDLDRLAGEVAGLYETLLQTRRHS